MHFCFSVSSFLALDFFFVDKMLDKMLINYIYFYMFADNDYICNELLMHAIMKQDADKKEVQVDMMSAQVEESFTKISNFPEILYT